MSTTKEFKLGQKVWITTNALPLGIRSATFVGQAWVNMPSLCKVIIDGAPGDATKTVWFKQLHATREAAVQNAESQRAKRIKSLQKQIAKVEAINF